MPPSTRFARQQDEKLGEIFEYGCLRGVVIQDFNWNQLKNASITWIAAQLFPENLDDEEEYIANGDEYEIHTKYVMYHCFLEMYYKYQGRENHRDDLFERIVIGNERGWEGCENITEDLNPGNNPIKPFHFFEKFEKQMFDCFGI